MAADDPKPGHEPPVQKGTVLNIDGQAFVKWLIDYSKEVGGLPIVIRPPNP